MGFCLIGQSEGAALLETDRLALDRYLGHLRSLRPKVGTCGVIVMNANPLTKGHLYLIDQASRRCDRLVIIPVADNPLTLFSYHDRRAMLAEAVTQFPHVTLAEASPTRFRAPPSPPILSKKRADARRHTSNWT